jgi:ketosteroid isomerase-like protein
LITLARPFLRSKQPSNGLGGTVSNLERAPRVEPRTAVDFCFLASSSGGILVGVSQQNVKLTRRAFQAFNDRDLDALLVGLHDEVEAFPRLAALEGGYRGHDGVRRWWAHLLGAFRDFHVEILEVRDLGEFIVLALRLRGHGAESDTPLDARVWHVNQFRDGKVIRWHVYSSESEALEAVGLQR